MTKYRCIPEQWHKNISAKEWLLSRQPGAPFRGRLADSELPRRFLCNPAVIDPESFRPVALRPRLSPGLPCWREYGSSKSSIASATGDYLDTGLTFWTQITPCLARDSRILDITQLLRDRVEHLEIAFVGPLWKPVWRLLLPLAMVKCSKLRRPNNV